MILNLGMTFLFREFHLLYTKIQISNKEKLTRHGIIFAKIYSGI